MNSSYYGDAVSTSYGISDTTGLLSVFVGIWTFIMIFALVASVVMVVSMWKMFDKAGKPGWTAIIPIYNIYIMCEIAGKEWWYILLLCVPLVNIYAMFVIYDGIAKKFGKTTGFTIGMMFLPFIFFTILGFSKNSVYLDSMEFFNNNSINELNEEISQEETILKDSNVSEEQPILQANTGYVAPDFSTSSPMMNQAAMPNMNEVPMMNQAAIPNMNETPVMNQAAIPNMNETPVMNQAAMPNMNETPMMNQTAMPNMNEAPVIGETVTQAYPQQEVNQVTDQHTSLWQNNNNNNGQN